MKIWFDSGQPGTLLWNPGQPGTQFTGNPGHTRDPGLPGTKISNPGQTRDSGQLGTRDYPGHENSYPLFQQFEIQEITSLRIRF